MSNRIAEAMAHLASRLQECASETITYTRGADSVSLTATLGTMLLKVNDGEGGVRVVRTQHDFIFPPADLVLASTTVDPQRGDVIGWDGREFTVMPPALGENVFQLEDPFGELIRVFTNETET